MTRTHPHPSGVRRDFTDESRVGLYSRTFPAVYTTAKGPWLRAEDGREMLDFFCGAGALNYGHNDERIKQRLVDYLVGDGLTHALDMHTTAKRQFLERLRHVVLEPRGLTYKVQFCGPTGANAVEAALKLARRATGRRGVVSFSGAFHGMSRGALEVTGSRRSRAAGGVDGAAVTFIPYEDGPHGRFDSIGHLANLLADPSSGLDLPAAVIVESVQMDGGVYVASPQWLRALRDLTERHGVLLISDEIQAGCGRTGPFFGFEEAGIQPDLVTVSKSISGYGLPLSLLLIRPGLDVWEPGEHTGTFRANQLALVAGAAALELWNDPSFLKVAAAARGRLREFSDELRTEHGLTVRGRGMVLGIDFGPDPTVADEMQRACFEQGLLVECCGRGDSVLKIAPPLTVNTTDLDTGIAMIRKALISSRVVGPR